MSKIVPWWFKMVIKIILSRLPFNYKFWKKIGIFKHGDMGKGQYAWNVFNKHILNEGRIKRESLEGKTLLELGPGDSISTAIIAGSLGMKSTLLDVGRYAEFNKKEHQTLGEILRKNKINALLPRASDKLCDYLALCNSNYLTEGIKSLQRIESNSIDYIFSQAVLEHIRRTEFKEMMIECARVMKKSGTCSHRVDLKDHLNGGLNNLRFPSKYWESDLFFSSGFYTNRIGCQEMIKIFSVAGLKVTYIKKEYWEKPPMKKSCFSKEFRFRPEEDIYVKGFDVCLRKL